MLFRSYEAEQRGEKRGEKYKAISIATNMKKRNDPKIKLSIENFDNYVILSLWGIGAVGSA